MHTLQIDGTTCVVELSQYSTGRKSITLLDKEDMWPYAIATINVPDIPLENDEVIIKNYSENEGILDVLIDNNIVSKPLYLVTTGRVLSPVCKLLI